MRRAPAISFVVLLSLGLAACSPRTSRPEHPAAIKTSKQPVVDTYHGVKVTDDYRWLEDGSDPEVQAWSDAQNARTRRLLDAIPSRAAIRERVSAIVGKTTGGYGALASRGGKLFALRSKPPLDQPFLVVMDSAGAPDTQRVILDPNRIDASGAVSIDWFVPSPDGTLVAVSVSRGGSESGDVHVIETAAGVERPDVIPRVNGGTAGGDLAWAPDGKGFYYTRYPRDGERPASQMGFFQQLWYHELGRPLSSDRYELGKDFERIAEIEVETDLASGRVLATVQYGDSGRFAHFVRKSDGNWKQISRYGDGIIEAAFVPEGGLLLLSRRDAPRGKILYLRSVDTPADRARVLIPQAKDVIVSRFYGARTLAVTPARLYLTYQLGGPSEIRAFDHEGKPQPGPSVPPISSVGSHITPLEGDDILFPRNSYLEPPAWYRYRAATAATEKTALFTEPPVRFDDTEVVREFAVSRDGTRVPINIIRRKGTPLDGNNPLILYGYGGFGSSLTPRYRPLRRIWLDQGGVYALANLRGGGEFGEEWHRAGMQTRKQNVFDDFAACMKYVVEGGYTRPERLVIEGGSNGGLLMGAMITQQPEGARVVISHVGIYDMLRVELSTNGRFNIPEYGTVKDPEQFRALYAYSPYHHVADGVAYPAILFLTGANDPRVDPMQSRKMTARLQAATSSDRPVLLRTSAGTGHGLSAPLSERIDQSADVYAFIFEELRMPFSK